MSNYIGTIVLLIGLDQLDNRCTSTTTGCLFWMDMLRMVDSKQNPYFKVEAEPKSK